MKNKLLLLDLDGVILNSEELILQEREKNKEKTWYEFFEDVDWKKIYMESKSINNSVEIIRELESMKKEIAILTKCHTLEEMRAKVSDLRNNRKIMVPVLFVPPHVKKTDIYIPYNNEMLIDDSLKNINDWNLSGGNGILFDEKGISNEKKKVKSLDFLLRK